MQCNQSFCGNGFANVPFYNCNNSSLQCCQSMYPDVVGEGEVTSVTLSDGTVQFFFMPTIKWWAPNASQCHPNIANPMFANSNYSNPHCNNNVGTWFVRSISNRLPQNPYSLPCHRSEGPRLYCHSDNNMNSSNNGYQLKFHNDNWTSTTDLHYFCLSLRQCDYAVKQSCKRVTTVHVQTEPVASSAVCHHEVICSKPCNCNACPKAMSLVSIVEPKLTTKCNSGTADDYSYDKVCKKHHKRDIKGKKEQSKTKHVCACPSKDKIITSEKSVTTYADEGSSYNVARCCQTQTCEIEEPKPCCNAEEPQNTCEKSEPLLTGTGLQKCQVIKAEEWQPVTPLSKRGIKSISSENLKCISDSEYNGCCSSICSCSSG